MARKLKKLSKEQINKNNSVEIKHYINKIKEQERKYTFLLVIFFMILFCIIGYKTLTINKEVMIEYMNKEEMDDFSKVEFVLTSDDVLSDKDGLLLKGYDILIKNNSQDNARYKVFFIPDPTAVKVCGCGEKSISKEYIRYSIDGTLVNTFFDSDEVLVTEELEKGEENLVNIKVWIDNNLKINNSFHFHGSFIIEKIKG